MRLATEGILRCVAVLLLLFFLVTCLEAEEGILVLQVVDARHHPFPNVRIALAGEGGSPQTSDQNGRMRLRLAPNTRPAAWATILLKGGPTGMDLVFVSPYDDPGRVRVPPFDNEQDNYDEVVVVSYGDKSMLERGSGRLAIEAAGVAAQRSAPKSQYRRLFGEPHLLTVALRLGPGDKNEQAATDQMPQAAMLAAAEKYGLSLADIKAAIASWGGRPLGWKANMMTASIEAGGTDPFLFVQATNQDIMFGAGSWSLRGCSLQPLLLKLQQRNPQLFAGIFGKDDSEWLNKALSSPCKASSSMVLERMLEGPGVLRRPWREKFRKLGDEPAFQRVQVKEMTHSLAQAQAQASALGLRSDQAVAYSAYVAAQAGAGAIASQQESFTQEVVAFKQKAGREPDEQEKLLILGNLVAASLKAATPPFTPILLAKASLLSRGEGTVLGRHYDLRDFGIGLNDHQTGVKLPVHQDKEIPPKPVSSGAPGQCSSAGPQLDATAEVQLADLINQERTKQGIPPLQVDPRLSQAAGKHAELLAQHRELSHQFDGEPPMVVRLSNENLPSDQEAENIAFAPNVATGHETMMQSTHHRTNILNRDYNVVGVAAVQCDGLWITQDFAHRLPEYSETQVDAALEEAINQYVQAQGMPRPIRKPETQLRTMACEMARSDTVDREGPAQLPGVHGTVVWRTDNPAALPAHAQALLSQPVPGGYSMGACFAPSASHPRGIYWVVMVTY